MVAPYYQSDFHSFDPCVYLHSSKIGLDMNAVQFLLTLTCGGV